MFEKREAVIAAMDELSDKWLKGKSEAVRLTMVAMLAGGHILLEDIPGVGKTTLALAIAGVLGISFGRIQCTTDLLPSDITGLSIYDRQEHSFRFVRGPVFNNILLVDEINRAMPKTQSALLEAMEEGRVTVEGVTYSLPSPFMVIATQNPIEHSGTYPLPESQMDRFMIRTGIGYPPPSTEKEIIIQGGIRENISEITAKLSADEILSAKRELSSKVILAEKSAEYLYQIVAKSRNSDSILNGISTRGAISLAAAAKACAYLAGRNFVMPEDIRDIAVQTLSHRLMMRSSESHASKGGILREILSETPIPAG